MPDTPPAYHHLSWAEFHRDTRELAKRLIGKQWQGIIAIARGGLVPATIIARELNIRLVDTICIASYDNEQQVDAQVLKQPEGDGEGFLLIDDLVDTGKTAQIARESLPNAHFVTVYAKPLGRCLVDEFVTEFAQDTWVHFPWDTELNYSAPLAER